MSAMLARPDVEQIRALALSGKLLEYFPDDQILLALQTRCSRRRRGLGIAKGRFSAFSQRGKCLSPFLAWACSESGVACRFRTQSANSGPRLRKRRRERSADAHLRLTEAGINYR